jgi:hypothetical protein
MPKRAKQKPLLLQAALPGLGEAQGFVCRCFGISEKNLDATLQRIRSHTPDADRHFPRKWSRVLPVRADAKKSRRREVILTIQREALYDRIRREHGKPLISSTGDVTEKIVFSLLRLYEKLFPKLQLGRCSKAEALWVLTEHVFLPTIFIHLIRAHREGLGPEFAGEKCWYFPVREGSKIVKPIPRLLDYWSRASALFTPYRTGFRFVAKAKSESVELVNKRDSIKKRFERWRSGEDLPTLDDLHRFVEDAGSEVAWLDNPAAWKARFTLALAAHSIADAMDEIFYETQPHASLIIAEVMSKMATEGIVCDDEMRLADPAVFFAVRLWQLKLMRDGHWQKIISASIANLPPFPPFTTVEADEEHRQKIYWQMNRGNHLLEAIKTTAATDGVSRQHPFALDDYLLELGVSELNRMLAAQNKKAGRR